MKTKILYIEISTAHTEIINSFVEALTPECNVHLIIHEKSIQRLQYLTDRIQISPLKEETYLSDILKMKKQFQPDLILLNSAQGRRVRDLCLRLLFDKTPIVGVHHNAENIFKSFTQKIIQFKIHKYVVLADFIQDFLRDKIDSKLQVESFYPVSYHRGEKINLGAQKQEAGQQWIVIPGVLEQDRRDYLGLIDMVQKNDRELDPRVKFVLLGNAQSHDGPKIAAEIAALNLQRRFILFDRYVEDDIMLSYVEHSLAVMPLLHPGTRWFEKYFETKISGAYNLAFAFNKHLLMHEIFKGKKEFESHAWLYNCDDLAKVVQELLTSDSEVIVPARLQFSVQKRKLLCFLNGID